jgi:tetratricopeptide (TPR) repeat protein
MALVSAAKVGAPTRPAADAISRASIAHGESTDGAVARLTPLLAAGGKIEYFGQLQVARLYRLDGRLDAAQDILFQTSPDLRDAQFELERGLQLVAREQLEYAERAILWAIEHPSDPPEPVPDGDDPLYWLATVQLRLGKSALAAFTARAGLLSLPPEQSSLRAPYHLLLGDSLLADGKPDEALVAFQAGQRLAPGDPRFGEGIARARAARR